MPVNMAARLTTIQRLCELYGGIRIGFWIETQQRKIHPTVGRGFKSL